MIFSFVRFIPLLAIMVATPVSAAFSDVSSSHPNQEAIEYVQTQGIVQGYADGTYRPDQTINRAEFAKILVLATWQGSYAADNCTTPIDFVDVAAGDWYRPYLCVAKSSTIIGGYPDGSFRPAQSINAVEAAKIIARANAINFYTGEIELPAESAGPWYERYVRYLADHKAIPLSISSFDQQITRGEMAEMIYRLKAGVTTKPSRTYEEMTDGARSSLDYRVRYNYTQGQYPLEEQYDGQIIATDQLTGRETVVVQSIKAALPALYEEWNMSLVPFARPEDTSKVVFKSALMETDNTAGDLYIFDSTSGRLSRMALSDVFDGFYSGSAISPDGKYVVWTHVDSLPDVQRGFVQTLWIGSLVNDTATILQQLPGTESFNGGYNAMASQFDIQWIDSKTVRFAVYDQMKKKVNQPAFIGYRTVEIE